jgi:6-phosphogluconolactonase (cycloisomerase 2 family)
VVNAGSNDISVFKVKKDGLYLIDTFDSGGLMPVSLTMNWRILYVLNAGVPNNITGFFIRLDGKLIPIPGSTRPLSGDDTGPAQVGFSPYGDVLVVTEKATSIIDVYSIYKYGIASNPDFYNSAGQTPFGFAFGRRNYLFVSEAAGGTPDASSVSSYKLKWNDTLKVVSPAVPTNQTAACWVVVTGNGRYAYTTNAGSGSVSGYKIDYKGQLTLLDPDGRTGDTGEGSGPIDMALSKNDKYLYTLNGGNNTISVFKVKWDGGLMPLQVVEGLPDNANGLAAR